MCVSGYMLNVVDPGSFNVTTNTSFMFICDPVEIQAQVKHKSLPPGHLVHTYWKATISKQQPMQDHDTCQKEVAIKSQLCEKEFLDSPDH